MLSIEGPEPLSVARIRLAVPGARLTASRTSSRMVSDRIDWQELQTGRREEGAIYIDYSLGRKLAQGVGGFVVVAGLSLIGYDAALAVQSGSVSKGIKLTTAGLPLPEFKRELIRYRLDFDGSLIDFSFPYTTAIN